MKSKEDIKTIVERLMELIRVLPDSTNTSTDKLLQKLGIICDKGDNNRIHYSLVDAAREEDIFLDTECVDSIDDERPISFAFTIYHNTPCYWYCGVGFEDIMTIHSYISDTGYIPSCSYVEVPFGNNNRSSQNRSHHSCVSFSFFSFFL